MKKTDDRIKHATLFPVPFQGDIFNLKTVTQISIMADFGPVVFPENPANLAKRMAKVSNAS